MNDGIRHTVLKASTSTTDDFIDDLARLLGDTCLDSYQSSLDARIQLVEVRANVC